MENVTRKNIFILSTLAFFFLIATSILFIYQQFQPVSRSESSENIRFVIPKGQAISVIAQRLAEAKLIRNPYAFRVELKIKAKENQLQAGSFLLSPNLTLSQIIEILSSGTEDSWVTIPEGYRREEVAQTLSTLLGESFEKDEFLSLTIADEGTLFPDTYLMSMDTSAQMARDILVNTFNRKVVSGLSPEINDSPHEFRDALIMASILEREATGAEEMRMVAGILWNRLELGMPLQADATLQYAKGYNEIQKSWWVPPLGVDKNIDSPYNTYLNPGLPPGPIANPGLDAIKAALEPTPNDYLFYLHDRQGNIHYAKTLNDHNLNVEKYLR